MVIMVTQPIIDYVNLCPADNGVTLSWTEKVQGNSTFDNCSYKEHTEVFLEKDIDKAFEKFKSLWKQRYEAQKKK